MTGQKALIWDFDVTLVDSYRVITDVIYELINRNGLKYTKEEIYASAILSVQEFFKDVLSEIGIKPQEIRRMFAEVMSQHLDDYILMPHAKETLDASTAQGISNFLFTHSDKSTIMILRNLGILEYFEEIVTKENGFPRKPEKAAIEYLIEKYSLDRKNTYYVGDRESDIECAQRAGILSILFNNNLSNIGETYKVTDLADIKEIFKGPKRNFGAKNLFVENILE